MSEFNAEAERDDLLARDGVPSRVGEEESSHGVRRVSLW